MAVSIRVEGLDEAIKTLANIAGKFPREADRIIEDAGERIFAQSQRLVPVDTGTLQRSGSHNHTELRSEVGYNTPYAEFVHDGTSKQQAQPFLRQAAEQETPAIKKDLEGLLEKSKA